MALSLTHQTLLKAELQRSEYDGLSAEDAYKRLHEVTKKNVNKTQPTTLTVLGLFSLLGVATRKKVSLLPYIPDIRRDILAQDRVALGTWLQVLRAGEVLDDADVGNVSASLGATETVAEVIDVPPRILEAFAGVAGMPNKIDVDDFTAAHKEARP